VEGGVALKALAATALAAALVAVGCGSVDTSASAGSKPYQPRFDPRNFRTPGSNPLLSLTPGKQTVRKGLVNVGHRRVEHIRVYTTTDVHKLIDGVRATAVLDQDFDAGEVSEQAIDYLAADKLGNIWYFGSYTESYEGGQYVNQLDAWLAGVNGGIAGILVPAKPRAGMKFFRDQVPGDDPDVGRVVKVNASACVPYRCFKNVVILEEPGGDEWKYYVAGVGGIWTRPVDKNDPVQETELLINVKKLTPRGLSEISNEVLKLDRHSRTTASSAYGRSAPARRA
jgi:hypothetical protein